MSPRDYSALFSTLSNAHQNDENAHAVNNTAHAINEHSIKITIVLPAEIDIQTINCIAREKHACNDSTKTG
jgi:hypothetical protein